MDPNQALAILQQACPQISTTLAQHQLIQQALSTLREALIPDPVPNNTADVGAAPVFTDGDDLDPRFDHRTGSPVR